MNYCKVNKKKRQEKERKRRGYYIKWLMISAHPLFIHVHPPHLGFSGASSEHVTHIEFAQGLENSNHSNSYSRINYSNSKSFKFDFSEKVYIVTSALSDWSIPSYTVAIFRP